MLNNNPSNRFDELVKALKNRNPSVRWNSVINLGKLNDYRSVHPLIEALKDEDKEVRGNAIAALRKLKCAAAVEPLLALINDNSKCEIRDPEKKTFEQTTISREVTRTLHALGITELPESKKAPDILVHEPQPGVSFMSIERTIFDPASREFVISSQRPIPNVKNWIMKNDPSMYWLIICVNNSSDRSIDQWGIELEIPNTLKILDMRIEGIEHTSGMKESSSPAWLTRHRLEISHHLGIVIPRKGSRRIYFKLGSNTCGISYSIKGKVFTSDSEALIREKEFRFSCDAPTLKVALRTNPEEAERYAHTVLSNAYSRDIALKLIHTFRIVQEIDRCCIQNQYGEIKFNNKGYDEIQDKLHILLDALESAQVGDNLIRMVKDNLDKISITGETNASAEQIRKLCGNLPDMWINEILKI